MFGRHDRRSSLPSVTTRLGAVRRSGLVAGGPAPALVWTPNGSSPSTVRSSRNARRTSPSRFELIGWTCPMAHYSRSTQADRKSSARLRENDARRLLPPVFALSYLAPSVDFSSVHLAFLDAKTAKPASRLRNLECSYSSAAFPRAGRFFCSLRRDLPAPIAFLDTFPRPNLRAPIAFPETLSTSPQLRPGYGAAENFVSARSCPVSVVPSTG